MMKEYKITLKNQWKNIGIIFFCLLLYIIGVAIGITRNGDIKFTILFFGILYTVQLIPALILHFQYYNINKEDEIAIDNVYKEIVFKHAATEYKFSIDDIANVLIYQSPASKRKDIHLLMWDAYNHSIIILKNNTSITITSLMTGGKFIIPVDEKRIKIKIGLYRWAKGPSLQMAD